MLHPYPANHEAETKRYYTYIDGDILENPES